MARFDESEHPRHPAGAPDGRGGEFAPADDWASRLVGRATGMAVGRDLRAERTVDWDRLYRIWTKIIPDSQIDEALDELYAAQGYHGKPTVILTAEMDRLEQQGAAVMYRGLQAGVDSSVSAEEMFDDFLYGEKHRPGLGVAGNGSYFTASLFEGQSYAYNARAALDTDGRVIRATLKPGARVIDEKDLSTQWDLGPRDHPPVNPDGEPMPQGQWNMLMSDEGHRATALGYDAIRVARPGGITHYVVLNRTALLVDENPTGTDYEAWLEEEMRRRRENW